jgi:midasin
LHDSKLQPVLAPLVEWTKTLPTSFDIDMTPATQPQDVDSIIDSLLVVVQNLTNLHRNRASLTSIDDDGFAKDVSVLLGHTTELLEIKAVSAKLAATFDQIASCTEDELRAKTSRILPFILRYERLTRECLTTLARWTENLFRLEFVVCTVLLNIATKGFCKPQELEDEAGENPSEDTSGVGLGEGSGTKDISNEIEDQSQVEGLREEIHDSDQQTQEQNRTGGENAVEMNEDFEEELQDVPDDEGDGDDEDNQKDDVQEDAMGDLDPLDPSAVDQKLWGDEKGPEESEEGNTGARSKEGGEASEIAAREGQREKADQETQDDSPHQDEKNTGQEDELDEEIEDLPPAGRGAPMDEFVQEADTLNLPDDVEIGRDEKTNGSDSDVSMDEDLANDRDISEDLAELGGQEFVEPDTIEQDNMEQSGDPDSQSHMTDDNGKPVDDELPKSETDEEVTGEPESGPGEESVQNNQKGDSLDEEKRNPANQHSQDDGIGGFGQSGERKDGDGDNSGYGLGVLKANHILTVCLGLRITLKTPKHWRLPNLTNKVATD